MANILETRNVETRNFEESDDQDEGLESQMAKIEADATTFGLFDRPQDP